MLGPKPILAILVALSLLSERTVDGAAPSQPAPQGIRDAIGSPSWGDGNAGRPPGFDLSEFRGVSLRAIGQALGKLTAETGRNLRGATEELIYARHSPAVVLIVTKDSLGSGTLISPDGRILTNNHVVSGYRSVAVIFKPGSPQQRPSEKDVRRATVVKVDAIRDLALLQVTSVPEKASTLALGALSDITVGSDVHAIGHPTGETWTYTKGLVSQIRLDYEWKASGRAHRATVVQTQTPINPGNSGGPLISNAGRLVGVNTFRMPGEGLNFAVGVDEVIRFLGDGGERPSTQSDCRTRASAEKKDPKVRGLVTRYDTNCDGRVDAILLKPNDKREPIQLYLDVDHDGVLDCVVRDLKRDGRWDESLWDTDGDGLWDKRGIHDGGDLVPTRWAPVD